MARLLSVNVGLPRDIEWNGRTVHTGIWKNPASGRCRAGRLNLEGDGQGDLAAHGGEHRAVFVYQIESYRYWQRRLKRSDLVYGQFGENLTVEGLADDEVCIGDRFRIGTALFEVTQPRVTCYRVGIRMNEPRMPSLLTGSGRPGFYFRVLREGEVGSGDEIVRVGQAPERMSIAAVNALLYSPDHPRDQLERALRVEALSTGWRASFESLLLGRDSGNAGLMPEGASHPAEPGFRRLVVTAIRRESADVLSFTLESPARLALPAARPGQFVVLRLRRGPAEAPLYRSYSLSGPRSDERYRISVKIEPGGLGGTWLRANVQVGDALDVSSPRGNFLLEPGARPVVLLSAGIGATPLLGMLHALASAGSTRPVLWLHAARDGAHHVFSSEVRRLIGSLPYGRSFVAYSQPGEDERFGVDFDLTGRLSPSAFAAAGVSRQADVYLCGPAPFMAAMTDALVSFGVEPRRIRTESFGGGGSLTPGVVGATVRTPHPPENDVSSGPLVSFARSGIVAHWSGAVYQNLLELAEACDVPVRWACRAGVCHNCECGLVSGAVVYGPEPLDRAAEGNLLICCSQPVGDVVVDL